MKVNSEILPRKKKRRHDETKELNEDLEQENKEGTVTSTIGLSSAKELIESHYELYENVKEHQIKRLKLVKESLLDSLKEPDNDVFEVDDVPVESSPGPQKEVYKRIENLTAEQDQKVKQIYRERYKNMRNLALLDLKEAGCEASLGINEEDRYPLVFPDIEELLLHLQYNRNLTRWLQVKRGTKLRNSIILCVEGPGLEEYNAQLEDCPCLASYKISVEFVSPLSYGDSIEHAFASKLDVNPPSKLDIKKSFRNMKSSTKKDGFVTGLDTMFNINWEEDKDKNKQNQIGQVESTDKSGVNGNDLSDENQEDVEYCLKKKQVLPVSLYKKDNFSRLELVMSPREMANEKYPLPFLSRYHGFVKTKEEYTEVTEKSPMFGLDCEMCETTAGSELTRISIVNEKHEVVYEKLVKPHNKIINYLTKYSGITPKMLVDVETRLSDVQAELRTLLPSDAILVGQSLNCDLVAMQMMHPYVIDTSLIFNLSGERRCKAKLKTLCAEFISENIQNTKKKGHDSIEDACGALKLVQAKLSHSLEWGDAVLGYKRTENESQLANQLLREKEAQPAKEKFRLALNGLVDDASKFLGPSHQVLSILQKENSESKGKLKKRRREPSETQEEPLNGLMKNRKVEESVAENETPQVDHTINYLYSQVAIIGSKEVRRKYKANLAESARKRVTFYKAKTSKEVMNKVMELDSDEDSRRLIIAHLKSPCVCRVEKWSLRLKTELRENDLVCISMCGSEGTESSTVRGALFATLPYVDNLPHVKQLVLNYLESCGHVIPDNTETAS